jgi:hypothetical protein
MVADAEERWKWLSEASGFSSILAARRIASLPKMG